MLRVQCSYLLRSSFPFPYLSFLLYLCCQICSVMYHSHPLNLFRSACNIAHYHYWLSTCILLFVLKWQETHPYLLHISRLFLDFLVLSAHDHDDSCRDPFSLTNTNENVAVGAGNKHRDAPPCTVDGWISRYVTWMEARQLDMTAVGKPSRRKLGPKPWEKLISGGEVSEGTEVLCIVRTIERLIRSYTYCTAGGRGGMRTKV